MLGDVFHQRNVQNIASQLASNEKGALLLFGHSNIRYATGVRFESSDRPAAACIWSNGSVAFFVPQRVADELAATWVRDIRWYPEFPSREHPARWMAAEAGESILVDSVDARTWVSLQDAAPDVELSDIVERLRAIKTPAEVDLIEQAADFSDLAVQRAFARLTTGAREREIHDDVIASLAPEFLHDYGTQLDDVAPAIEGRIVGGPRAAFPGAITSERPFARGDLVIVEYTVAIGGYHARAGSCFFVGTPLRDLVDGVRAAMSAQSTVRTTLQPETPVGTVSIECRRALERSGLSNAIRHRPGQGIGLDQNELPWLVQESDDVLRAGMVVVNQPGVYLPGRTGIRHAETVLIEDEGPRVLNPRNSRWDDPDSRIKEF
jgi:Xaa-Pro dipeptidase